MFHVLHTPTSNYTAEIMRLEKIRDKESPSGQLFTILAVFFQLALELTSPLAK